MSLHGSGDNVSEQLLDGQEKSFEWKDPRDPFRTKSDKGLPPIWVDKQEAIDDLINEVKEDVKKLQWLYNQRMDKMFEDDDGVSWSIHDTNANILTKIAEAEYMLKEMQHIPMEHKVDETIRKNV